MRKLTKAILVSSLALIAGCTMLDCEAPSGLIGPFEKKDVPDKENAYLGYIAATNAVREWPEDFGDLTPERKAEFVATNAEALALMRKASACSVWYDTDFHGDGSVGFDFVRMMNMMCWDTEAQIAHGDGAAALKSIRSIASFAATMRGGAEGRMYWQCADMTMRDALCLAMKFANASCATDGDLAALAAFLRSLPDIQSQRHSLCITARREAFYWGEFAFRKSLPDHYEHWSLGARYKFHPNRSWRMYLDMMRRVCNLVERDYDKEAWRGLMAEIKSMKSGVKRCLPNLAGKEMVALSLGGWDSTALYEAFSEFHAAATEVVVAVERHRRNTGIRTKNLSALVPEYMPSVPKDPFKTDAPLNYDHARGIVWTVGPDGDFNGEKLPGKDSYGRNSEYVMNLDGTKAY